MGRDPPAALPLLLTADPPPIEARLAPVCSLLTGVKPELEGNDRIYLRGEDSVSIERKISLIPTR